MTSSTPDPSSLDAASAAVIARLRRLMLIAGLTLALGLCAVLAVIGYRLFRSEGSATVDATALLPKGSRIVSTGASGDRLLVTVEIAGATEIRSFDPRTMKPAGRLRFANEP
jgi:hypothetical protein